MMERQRSKGKNNVILWGFINLKLESDQSNLSLTQEGSTVYEVQKKQKTKRGGASGRGLRET